LPVPDGPYSVSLQQAGAADLQAPFWVEHAAQGVGALSLAPQPARWQVTVDAPPPPGQAVVIRVYDLSGGLVAQWAPPPSVRRSSWDLRGPSGQPVSSGLYVVEARYFGPGTLKSVLTKLAVLR
jgi:hypothetical protein